MKAIICTKYGAPEHLELRDIPCPIPKETEVLIKVYATAATTADSMMRRADPWIARLFLGVFRPRAQIIGTAVSGEIVDAGDAVTDFEIGDQVCGETGLGFGAYAEYVAVDSKGAFINKPKSLSHTQAAPISDGFVTSLNFLQNIGKIQAGQTLLIIGASGALGTAAIQIAKNMGVHVTAVCSTDNMDLVRELGADRVIDRLNEDYTKNLAYYDVIYDTVGKSSFRKSKAALRKKGRYICPVLNFELLFQMLISSRSKGKRALFAATGMLPAPELRLLLEQVSAMFEDGKLRTVIDRVYPFDQMRAAHTYVDTGKKRGNLAIKVSS